MTKMIQKNTTIPTRFSEMFSTADDNQPAVTVKVYQGEREIVAANKLLGEFNLEGIAPAPRGMPQVEVSFDIDANGILHVGARDKATGKENQITIKANSGLTEPEIQKMVQDAVAHADEDRRARQLAESRNSGDALAHSTRKMLKEAGERIDRAERDRVNAALASLDAAVKGSDKAEIDANIAALSSATQQLTEKLASQSPPPPPPPPPSGAAPDGQGARAPGGAEDVVDAEFREVKGA